MYLNRNKIYGFIDQKKITSLSILIVLTVVCLGYKSCAIIDDSVHTWYGELGNISISILIWYFVNYMIFSNIKQIKGGIQLA